MIQKKKLEFYEADSFSPYCVKGRATLDAIRNLEKVDFLVANPPADFGTPLHYDGFE